MITINDRDSESAKANLNMPVSWAFMDLIRVDVGRLDGRHFIIPFEPYHDLVQTVMDTAGLTGEIPYIIIALFMALAVLFILINGAGFLRQSLSGVLNALGDASSTGDARERQLQKELRRALRNSDWQSAAECSEGLGAVSDAAKYYQLAGQNEKAGSFYEKKGDYASAASCYASIEQFERAADLLLKAKDELSAAAMFERSKNFIRAALLYESAQKFAKAAVMIDLHFKGISASDARDTDLLKGSARIYEKAGNTEKAAEYYLQAGSFQKAGELYEKSGKKAEAAELFSKSRDFARAASLFEDTGQHKKAGELLGMMHSMNGDYAGAAERYLQAEDYFRAADCFHAAGQHQQAAEIYLKGGYNAEAAESYARSGDWLKAAEISEKSEHFESAANYYEECAEYHRAIDCYRRAGRHYRAGHLLMKKDRVSEALDMFDLVEKEDPDYMLSQAETGVCLFKLNNVREAGDVLEKALAGLSPDSDTKEAFYTLGLIYERAGRRHEARKIFRRVQSVDDSFLDVKERMQRLSAAVPDPSGPSAGQPAVAAGGGSKIEQRYEIIRELGRGGMGVVSQARDRLLDRDVALKQLTQSVFGEKESHARFLREARAASRLNHSNIVSVYDVIEDDNALVIAMEYVDGISLSQYLKRHPRPAFRLVLALAVQVADALQSAHEGGVIHRDIKPDNIMITRKGRVKITDFGIARLTESDLTASGIVMGTMKYMSPEQIKGETVTAGSDLYSFGVVLYEMVTGAPPFVKGEITYHHVHTEPVAPRQVNQGVPEPLEDVILKCLAKDPGKRYPTARDLFADLKKIQGLL